MEEWRQYAQKSEMYFEINNVPDLRRVPFVLVLMGSQMYALLMLYIVEMVSKRPRCMQMICY